MMKLHKNRLVLILSFGITLLSSEEVIRAPKKQVQESILSVVTHITGIQDIIRGYLNCYEIEQTVPLEGTPKCWSQDGRYIIITDPAETKNLWVWDCKNKCVCYKYNLGPDKKIITAIFLRDSDQIALNILNNLSKRQEWSRTLIVVNTVSNSILFAEGEKNVGALSCSPDGTYFAYGKHLTDREETLEVHRTSDFSRIIEKRLPTPIYHLEFSPCNTYLVNRIGRDKIAIIEISTGKIILEITDEVINSFLFTSEKKLAISSSRSRPKISYRLSIWDINNSATCIQIYEFEGMQEAYNNLTFSPDFNFVAHTTGLIGPGRDTTTIFDVKSKAKKLFYVHEKSFVKWLNKNSFAMNEWDKSQFHVINIETNAYEKLPGKHYDSGISHEGRYIILVDELKRPVVYGLQAELLK